MKYSAIVVASGKGERAKLGFNKVFFVMKDGMTVLEKACQLFINDDDCERVIVVTNRENFDEVFKSDKLFVCEGGKERKDSVNNGLKYCDSPYVLIHDAARPFLHIEMLEEVKKAVLEKDAVILARKAIDTIKVVKEGFIEKTIDRNLIYLAETPQAFRTDLIKMAYEKSLGQYTDDASLLEDLGYKVGIVSDIFDNH